MFVNPAGIIDAFSTPTVARDPRAPSDLVIVYRQDRPELSSELARSSNGGHTWSAVTLPLPPGHHKPFFPDAAFGPDGSLYVVYDSLSGRMNVPDAMWLVRSNDGGAHLGTPVQVAGPDAFQPRILVGTHGEVRLTWLQLSTSGARLSSATTRILSAASADGGTTFSSPVEVSPPGQEVGSPTPVLDTSGVLVVAYEDLGASATATRGSNIYDLVVSRVHGPGFAAPVVVARSVVAHQDYSLFDNIFPAFASSPGGHLYLAWSNRHGAERVMMARSSDGGASWSSPIVIQSPTPGIPGTSDWLPAIAAPGGGRVDVAFLQAMNDHYTDAYLATSTNRGASFSIVKLSSDSFDSRVGPSFGGTLPADLGSHLGIAATPAEVQVAWADSVLGTQATGRQDIVTATGTTPGSGPRAPELVGAGIAAFAALGCSLIWALSRRTRAGR
jgi:hypothetical protein